MNTCQSPEEIIEGWQRLTTTAQALFDHGDYPAALESYEQALAMALTQFPLVAEADEAVAVRVVSYLNLSEVQARLGLTSEATLNLCTVHGNLLKTESDENLPEEIRIAARRHLRETFAALVRFHGRYGLSGELARWLQTNSDCAGRTDMNERADDAPPFLTPLHALLPAPTLMQ